MSTGQDTTAAPCDESDIVTTTRTCGTDPSSLDNHVLEGFPPLPDEMGDEEESLSGSTLNNDDTDDGDGDTAPVDSAWKEICKRPWDLDGLSKLGRPSSPLTANLDGSFKFRRNSDPTPSSYDGPKPYVHEDADKRKFKPPGKDATPPKGGAMRRKTATFPGTIGPEHLKTLLAAESAERRARAVVESLQQDSSVSGEEGDPEEESVCTVSTEPAQSA